MGCELLQEKYDVVVCGGGTAGAIAALAATRQGASVLLVEQDAFLGGNATSGLPFLGFYGPEKMQIVDGIPGELVRELVNQDASPGHIIDPRWYSFTPFNPDILKLHLLRTLTANNVHMLFHATVLESTVDARGRISDITVRVLTSKYKIHGRVFVDATGDGTLASAAGLPIEKDCALQAATLVFRLSGFDRVQFAGFIERHPEEIKGIDEGWVPSRFSTEANFAFCGLFNLLRKAIEENELSVPVRFICFNTSFSPEYVTVVGTRILGLDATNGMLLSEAEAKAQLQVWQLLSFLHRHVPGFEKANLCGLSYKLGIRETRRLIGQYILTSDDVTGGRIFQDTVALGSWPIDIHSGTGAEHEFIRLKHTYGIPYRSMYSKSISNLMVAGRCISVTHEAHGSTRTMAQCMATGQAAGTASAMAAESKCGVGEVSIQSLRGRLKADGAILNLPHFT